MIDKLNVFECLNQSSFSISNSSLSSPFLKHLAKLRVLNLGWLLNRGKDNKETLIETTKWWPWPFNRGNWSTGVLFAVFY